VPAGVLGVIDKMMAKSAKARYAAPGDVVDALMPFTQTAITPPTDVEMPTLSPAATGQVDDNSGRLSPVPILNRPGKTPAPAAVQTAATAVATAAPKRDESPWEQGASETDNLAAAFDTATLAPPAKTKAPAAAANKRALVVAGVVAALVAIPLCLIVSIATATWLFFQKHDDANRSGPRRLHVSRDPSRKNAQPTIQAALKLAEIDSVIELWDEVYEENVVVESARGRTAITLQAAEGKEIVWRSAKTEPDEPILRIRKGPDFKLRGKGITFDGVLAKEGRVNDLIVVNLESPGLTLEDLTLKNFTRSAVFIMNAGGTTSAPLSLHRLQIYSDAAARTRGAIYFDANPKVNPPTNDFIDITNCKFHGFDNTKAIQVKDDSVNGTNVTSRDR
jgi:hypothetical protein